jgi:hypothetical protein
VGTNRDEQRVNRHRKRKKNVGELPHITVGPYKRPRDSSSKLALNAGRVNVMGDKSPGRSHAAGIPRYATIRPSDPLEAR